MGPDVEVKEVAVEIVEDVKPAAATSTAKKISKVIKASKVSHDDDEDDEPTSSGSSMVPTMSQFLRILGFVLDVSFTVPPHSTHP